MGLAGAARGRERQARPPRSCRAVALRCKPLPDSVSVGSPASRWPAGPLAMRGRAVGPAGCPGQLRLQGSWEWEDKQESQALTQPRPGLPAPPGQGAGWTLGQARTVTTGQPLASASLSRLPGVTVWRAGWPRPCHLSHSAAVRPRAQRLLLLASAPPWVTCPATHSLVRVRHMEVSLTASPQVSVLACPLSRSWPPLSSGQMATTSPDASGLGGGVAAG